MIHNLLLDIEITLQINQVAQEIIIFKKIKRGVFKFIFKALNIY